MYSLNNAQWETNNESKSSPFQKLIVAKLFKKFPIFYETGRLITVLTKARHSAASSASIIQIGRIGC
jgi:hypothetical protein